MKNLRAEALTSTKFQGEVPVGITGVVTTGNGIILNTGLDGFSAKVEWSRY
jgi:hypothetical protein